MLHWITGLMDSMGYFGVVLLMFLENVFPPIPSELIMPLAGFSSTQGRLSLVGVVIAGMVGSVLGALPLYYAGKLLGKERIHAWADRHGKWLAVSGDDVEKSDAWFDRQGHKAVLFGRLVPGVRSLLSIPAGISGMPLPKFLLYSAIGTGLWSALLAHAGRLLGRNYEKVSDYLGPAAYAVLGLLVVLLIVRAVRRHKGPDKNKKRMTRQTMPPRNKADTG